MILVQSDTTISEESKVAEIFCSFLDGTVDGLNIKRCEIFKELNDPIVNAVKTFAIHSSILKIK